MASNPMNSDFKNYRDIFEADHFEGQEHTSAVPVIGSQSETWKSWMIRGTEANRFYNQFVSSVLAGPFNRTAMLRALQDLVNMHQALRMTFNAEGENMVCGELISDINYQDLSSQSPAEQQLFMKRHQKLTVLKPFDLEKGPLFKVSLFKLNNGEQYMTFVAHPIICDERYIAIMMKDLVNLYSDYAPNGMVPNAPMQ